MQSTNQFSLTAIGAIFLSTSMTPAMATDANPVKPKDGGEQVKSTSHYWYSKGLAMGFIAPNPSSSIAEKVSLLDLSAIVNANFTGEKNIEVATWTVAQAEPATANSGSWYGGLGLGFNSPNLSNSTTVNIPFINLSATVNTNFTGDSSLGYNGFVGYKMPNGYRAEGEIFYTNSQISGVSTSVNGTGASAPTVVLGSNSTMSHLAVMLNGYYDFNTNSKITPFVGAGVGYGSTNISSNATATISGATVPLVSNTSTASTSGFAYQFKAGVGYALTDRNDIYLQYRYLSTVSTPSYNTNSLEVGTKLSF
jgi:opacity protein-like surface antigen